MKRRNDVQQQPTSAPLKYGYIWQNLDNLFQQLDQQDVNDLNLKFMTLTCEKISAKNVGH